MNSTHLVYPQTDIPFLEEQAKFAVFQGIDGARLAIFYPEESAFSGLLFEPISLEFRKAPIAQSKDSNVAPRKFALSPAMPHIIVTGQSKALAAYEDADQRIKAAQKDFRERIEREMVAAAAIFST